LGEFVAFKAAIALIKERNMEPMLQCIFEKCKELKRTNQLNSQNIVREVYKPFTLGELDKKIAELITPPEIDIPVEVIYQTIEDLHECCPTNKGDWYFTGNYPTPGGNRVVNTAFLNYMEGKNERGY